MRHSVTLAIPPADLRPPSLLARRRVSAKMAAGGALAMAGAHLGVPGVVMLALSLLSAGGAGKPHVRPILEEHVVEAHFVKLGKKLDPRKIPNRKVPIKSTAPQPGVAVSKEMEPPKPQKVDAGPLPEQPVEDLLTRLGDRAQAFAEIAERQEQEGDPLGVADGTETTAQAGDLYLGQVREFFKRGWTVPNTLNDPSALVTRVDIEITTDLHVGPHELVKSSGNALFDQSVEDRVNQLRAQGASLPEPPPEVADKYRGGFSIGINFKGSDAR